MVGAQGVRVDSEQSADRVVFGQFDTRGCGGLLCPGPFSVDIESLAMNRPNAVTGKSLGRRPRYGPVGAWGANAGHDKQEALADQLFELPRGTRPVEGQHDDAIGRVHQPEGSALPIRIRSEQACRAFIDLGPPGVIGGRHGLSECDERAGEGAVVFDGAAQTCFQIGCVDRVLTGIEADPVGLLHLVADERPEIAGESDVRVLALGQGFQIESSAVASRARWVPPMARGLRAAHGGS